tara:strand:- start:965 stop:1921 length:957 start_codon:yes stop_codon:yes gene_type:complete
MKKIAVIEKIHKDGLDIIEKNPEYEYELISDVSEENLIKKLPDYDACTLRVSKLNENILKHCPKLKVISRHGVGFDNVDLHYIKENNITLLITATANAVAVAEHVIYLMLSISKSISQYDKEVRLGNFKKNASSIETLELFNKEVLIVGFGRIGKRLIKRCLGFEMKVNVYDPFVSKDIISQFGGNKIDNLNNGLKSCDYLSLHIPLTEKTKNMINSSKLKSMKKNAIIINTSRGGVINEIDLNNALNEKVIFGAGLDVFKKEPVDKDNPLLKNNKALLSPHSATFTNECKSRMSIEAVKNIIDFFNDKLDKSMIVKL